MSTQQHGGSGAIPDSFRGMGAWMNSTETQQSDHAPRSGPEVKNGRTRAKDGVPKRLKCRAIYVEGGELDPAEGISRRCSRIILPFSSA